MARIAFSKFVYAAEGLGLDFMRPSYTEETNMHLAMRRVFQFQCPLCSEHMILPRQSPLGTYVDQQYQPSGIWPINFLCFRYGQVSQVPRESIHLDTIVVQAPVSGEAALWQIECECVHENCGMYHAIYTKYLADESAKNVERLLLDSTHLLACTQEHNAEFSAERTKAEKFEF